MSVELQDFYPGFFYFDLNTLKKRYADKRMHIKLFEHLTNSFPLLSYEGPWLCGGAVRRLISGEPFNSDFDLFTATEEQFHETKDKLEKFNSQNIIDKKVQHSEGKMILYTLKLDNPVDDKKNNIKIRKIKVQLIGFFKFHNIYEVLKNFHFSICQFGYDGTFVYTNSFALYDLASKRLIPERFTSGITTLKSIAKYSKDGYEFDTNAAKILAEKFKENPETITFDAFQKYEYNSE